MTLQKRPNKTRIVKMMIILNIRYK